MIQFLRIAVVTAAVSASASAQAPLPSWMRPNPGVNMQDARESQLMRPLVVSVPGMERVRVRENIAYTQTDDSLVRMDVYEPLDARRGERRPAVLYVHGGTGVQYRPKDWGGFQARGRLAAASGFVGIVFTHRVGFPDMRLKRGAQDVAAAIDFVHRNAATLGVDPERLCLVVYSAGGPLMTPYLVDAPRHIQCVVGVVPFMDMREMEFHKQLETTETLNEFSPVLQVSASRRPVPLLIVRAGKDEIPDVNKSIDQFVPAALAANYPFAIVNHPEGGHGFETQHHSERTKEVIAQTLAFLRYHLGLSSRSQPPLSLSAPVRE
ncbi:MAG TPA: alpha/beta hydrolase [Gemmatimonadaceae bacterium]|nr:alpha/beta hydrolase [Gemmatimonadaceae bacterium]